MVDRFNFFVVRLFARMQDDEGQSMAEYALILALVAVVAIATLTLLGNQIGSKFSSICSSLKNGNC